MKKEEVFVQIEKLQFSFGEQLILKDISLTLQRETSYAILGQSGIGKSTLLNIIAGFLKPQQGRIMIEGQELIAARKQSAYLFQELGLLPWQTVYEALVMPLKLNKESKKLRISQIVEDLLFEMNISYLKEKYPNELSGGEKQRVALARTLIGKPDLILMDEPTSSLDAMTKEVLWDIILKYQKKLNATLVFITHDIEEAVLLGKEIIIFNQDGSLSVQDNPYFGIPNPKEQLGFYEICIELRKRMKMGIEQ